MALKAVPPAAAQRLRDDIEADLRDASDRALRTYLAHVRAQALRSVKGPLPDVLLAAGTSTDEMPPLATLAQQWAEQVDGHLMEACRAALYRAWNRWTDKRIEESPAEHATASYLAQVRSRLVLGTHMGVTVYEDSFNRIRESLATSAAEGWTRPQLAQRIATELGWEQDGAYWRGQQEQADRQIDDILDAIGPPGHPGRENARLNDPVIKSLREDRNVAIKRLDAERSVWQTRADLIARTESTGGANFGALQALTMEGVATKVWDASGDARVRLTHEVASGQEVGVALPFVVGGFLLQFPGDPSGPIQEVAGCRCAMVAGDYAEPVRQAQAGIQEDKEAAQHAALVQKWGGKPKPKHPGAPPAEPQPTGRLNLDKWDHWLAGVNQRYREAFPGKSFFESNNYSQLKYIYDDPTGPATLIRIQKLYDEKYLDQALRNQIESMIAEAKQLPPDVLKKYKLDLANHKRRMNAYTKRLEDWRMANPDAVSALQGMDGALSHTTDGDGVDFANQKLRTIDYLDPGSREVVRYTGQDYEEWNRVLYDADGQPFTGDFSRATKNLDAAFVPHDAGEDYYVFRGTSWSQFELNGVRSNDPVNPRDLIGTLQVQRGYMSTSVGTESAFSHKPVQIIFRVPRDHKALNVMKVSNYLTAEREVLLARDTRYFVHSVKWSGSRWIVEAEIVPDDFDPVNADALPLSSRVHAFGGSELPGP